MDWDELFLRHVYLIGSKSKDKSTQIGSVVVRDKSVILQGYNGICRGVDERPERLDRPEKYHWTEHGERNAIYQAARFGISTMGATMYTNYPPCTDCARAVVQAGIEEIVFHKQWADVWDKTKNAKWAGHDNRSLTMFEEAGVDVRWVDKFLGVKCLMSEQVVEV